jgi:hypothetical protein
MQMDVVVLTETVRREQEVKKWEIIYIFSGG